MPGHTIEYSYAPDSRELSSASDIDRATVDYSRDAEHRVTQIQYLVNGEHFAKPSATPTMHWAAAVKATLANGITVSLYVGCGEPVDGHHVPAARTAACWVT